MDYSSMVESLDKMLKEAAADCPHEGEPASQVFTGAGNHQCIRSHSCATSPLVDGVPPLLQGMNARLNLSVAPMGRN
ncbi:hypothetical protein [Pseudomonas sp. NY5710]|uniref:hypothetical protein n=1 Tax=Pseudomonas TaxID=286 RepID=UPI00156FE239|nr:hypothetical protein [Pseudomonas sp. NY5710]QKL01633.1 hypothetical protein GEV39_09580 [Pseudomonas sp. NY5710]